MKPAYLKQGDSVAIVATAKKIQQGEIDGAINLIESWGLKVKLGANLYNADRQFSGTVEQRLTDLQWAIDAPEIKAVLFARGGYGTVHLVDHLDWTMFQSNPKWLCGFSDLTVLHSHVQNLIGVETLHSSMPIFFKDGQPNLGSDSLKKALFGEHSIVEWNPHSLNRTGEAKGQLVGGNLSVLYSISGSKSEVNTDGKILFLEDLTENLYHLDRMMMQLKRSGKLSNLAGLVVGQFTEMIDNTIPFGKTFEQIILDAVLEYSFPVAFNAPIGHVDHNEAVFYGRSTFLIVNETESKLEF